MVHQKIRDPEKVNVRYGERGRDMYYHTSSSVIIIMLHKTGMSLKVKGNIAICDL